jgi:hypothetical protein
MTRRRAPDIDTRREAAEILRRHARAKRQMAALRTIHGIPDDAEADTHYAADLDAVATWLEKKAP